MIKLIIVAGVLLLILIAILITLIVRRKRSSKSAGANDKHQSHSPEIQAKATEVEETPPLPIATKQEAAQETVLDLAIEQITTLESVTPVAPLTHNLTPPPPSFPEHIPQDSMLRRHYLAHLRSQIESLKLPRPSDSSLARHYDSMVAAELETCFTDKSAIEQLQDRYGAYNKSALSSLIQPAPAIVEPKIESAPGMAISLAAEPELSLEPDLTLATEPELSLEPDLILATEPELSLEPDLALATETELPLEPDQAIASEPEPPLEPDLAPIPEPALSLETPLAPEPVKIIASQAPTGFILPEDATLRRHTLSHIRAVVESALPPRPTDSALRRHHDHLVEEEIQKRLGEKPQ